MFFPRIFNILWPLPRKDRAAISCAENGQPIRVTVHSDLSSDDLISYMQGIGKFGKKTILIDTLYMLIPAGRADFFSANFQFSNLSQFD